MGRNLKPLFKDSISGVFFARFYAEGKMFRLSLSTADEIEAMKRMPIVRQSRMSWTQYNRVLSGMNTMVVNAIDGHQLTPALTYNVATEPMADIVKKSLESGQGNYIPDKKFFVIKGLQNGVPTDSTAMTSVLSYPDSGGVFRGIESLRVGALIDNRKEIEDLFTVTMNQIYTDKDRVECVSRIWLSYLAKKDIKSWGQITENFMVQYMDYRKTTPVPRGRNSKVGGVIASPTTLKREIQFFDRAFTEAVDRGFMKNNPVRNWKPDTYIIAPEKPLTIPELKQVFDGLNGTIRDICILLFVSCKRRKEITSLQIDNVNFTEHYVSYTEFKNISRVKSIHKAFCLTPAMGGFLRRVIGDRTTGSLWPETFHPDFISHKFQDTSFEVAKEKHATLKNLRQCATDCMEKSGLSDEVIDATLGHIPVSTALTYYKDRSPDAIYRRLSERTRPGIEVLSKSIEEYLK